jgi:hypothetical protein
VEPIDELEQKRNEQGNDKKEEWTRGQAERGIPEIHKRPLGG